MKRIILFLAAAALMMAGCTTKPKQTVPSAEENAAAIAAYEQLKADMEAAMETVETEEAFEEVFGQFLDSAKVLIQRNKGGELVYVALPDLFYYLTTEEKTEAFEGVHPDSLLSGKLGKQYKAYQAEVKTAVGCQYTDFACPLLEDGESLNLSQLVGTKDYVLVDFWASWCGPCRASMPAMREIYADYSSRLQILGVSLDSSRERWDNCINTMALNWIHVSDLQGWDCAPAALYGVCSIPATVLIDRDGRIVARNIEPDELRAMLAE